MQWSRFKRWVELLSGVGPWGSKLQFRWTETTMSDICIHNIYIYIFIIYFFLYIIYCGFNWIYVHYVCGLIYIDLWYPNVQNHARSEKVNTSSNGSKSIFYGDHRFRWNNLHLDMTVFRVLSILIKFAGVNIWNSQNSRCNISMYVYMYTQYNTIYEYTKRISTS